MAVSAPADPVAPPIPLTEEERFRFELQGFVVLKQVIGRAVAARMAEESIRRCGEANSNSSSVGRFSGFLDWRALIDHPRILGALHATIGSHVRLDHCYGMAMRADRTPGGEHLHHHAAMFDYGCFHVSHNQRLHNGLVAVGWALTDAPPGAGGFCCIPGTHKATLPVPEAILGNRDHPLVVRVAVEAGDAIVFSEALTHGTIPWTLATHERRTVLLKYTPGYMQWSTKRVSLADPSQLSERQRLMLEPAYAFQRVPIADL